MRAARLVAMCVFLASCGGKKETAPGDKAAPLLPKAGWLDPPPGYKEVKAQGDLLAAWEAPPLPSGFTPTLRLAREAASSKDATAACNAWRDRMFDTLKSQYGDAKKLGGSDQIVGPAAPGCLLIALVMQPTPENGKPLALLAYGAAYPRGETLYTLAALTGTTIDEKSGELGVRDLSVLKALGTFRSPPP